MTAVVEDIVEVLMSAISSIGTSMASGIGATLKALFIVETTTGTGSDAVTTQALSTTGAIIVGFGAIALGLGVCRLCVSFIFGLGKSRL